MCASGPVQGPKKGPNEEEPKKNDKMEDFISYAKENTRDVVAYVLMILGLLLMFFQPIYGGLLIGLVVGAYFSSEILTLLKNYESLIDEYGLVKSLIIAGLLVAFLISAPAIFLGAFIVVGLRFFLLAEK